MQHCTKRTLGRAVRLSMITHREGRSVVLPQGLSAVKKAGSARLKSIFESRGGFVVAHFLHWLLWAASSLIPKPRGRAGARAGTAIVCPPGGGNIGDQALVESAAWNSASPVTLVVRSESNYGIPGWLTDKNVNTLELPQLLYGVKPSHFRDVLRFMAIARRSKSVVFIGADIMDGRYSAAASVNRWSLALLASACGADTSVLGFSWNASPSASSQAGLLKADGDAALWVRDPVSLQRTRELGASRVRMCADIVFAHPVLQLPSECGQLPESIDRFTQSGDYAVVNASGFIGSDNHIVVQYRAIVEMLREAGLSVVLLPHVMRGFSDLDCLRQFHLEDGRSLLIDSLLSPAQVAALARGARLVVTGRMHLAVLASLVRTPVLTLATQGKVDGLYELLERPEWVLDSRSDFSKQVLKALDEVGSSNLAYPTECAYNNVKELARLPFVRSSEPR